MLFTKNISFSTQRAGNLHFSFHPRRDEHELQTFEGNGNVIVLSDCWMQQAWRPEPALAPPPRAGARRSAPAGPGNSISPPRPVIPTRLGF